MNAIPRGEMKLRAKLENNLALYASACLEIRTKIGAVERFRLNRIQRHLHQRLEAQRQKTGKVRAIVLKGRQMGCSTYIGARFYHRATHSHGKRVYILTHSDQATSNLFDMVQRFHEHCPPEMRPKTSAASAKELAFGSIDSSYQIGTAGTKDIGRSQTIQLFHGSEVAFWPHGDTHVAGILQAVPDAPGTEVILESTANGFDPLFHKMWVEAERGKSDFQAIFLPWYWCEEYIRPITSTLSLSKEDSQLQEAYDLADEQMSWRAHKITELKSELLFKQEYPMNAAEAFQLTGHDSFIPASIVLKARKTMLTTSPVAPLVIGFDPAWTGGDRHSMAFRRGRKVLSVLSRVGLTVVQSAGWAAHVIQTERPAKMFIDVGGVGAGVYDILEDRGFGEIVVPVQFGSPPLFTYGEDHGGPANRRAEMWQALSDWLHDPAGVQLPDSDTLQEDLCGPAYSYNTQSRLLLESKEHMRKRNVLSPDEGDAVALTFAEPVIANAAMQPLKLDRRWVV